MEFRHLRTFEVVASLMNFNRAAEVLHYTQSAISAQIRALEEDLGTPLFERLGRRVALTSAGEELLRHVRKLLDYEQQVYSAIKGRREESGMLSIRVPQSVSAAYLPAILSTFHKGYPRVGLDVSNCGYYRLADELRAGVIDAAFLLADSLAQADLHSTRVLVEPLVFVASPACELAGRSSLRIQDLDGCTLLVPKHDCGYRMGLERSLKVAHVQLATLIELNCITSMVRCLKRGLGVALLPRIAVHEEVEAGQLVVLDWETPMQSGLLFLRHRDKPLEGAFAAFVDAVETYFRSLQTGATAFLVA